MRHHITTSRFRSVRMSVLASLLLVGALAPALPAEGASCVQTTEPFGG